MCNLYSVSKSQSAIAEYARAMRDMTGHLPPLLGIFPDDQMSHGPGLRAVPWDSSFRNGASSFRLLFIESENSAGLVIAAPKNSARKLQRVTHTIPAGYNNFRRLCQ